MKDKNCKQCCKNYWKPEVARNTTEGFLNI